MTLFLMMLAAVMIQAPAARSLTGTWSLDTTLSGSMTVKPFEVSGTFKGKKKE